jgi:NADH:ubiquinone oxidoreductase subunit 5 (subunit L)/multisubunit Na+/H+ antiporter MnhA subunit
LFIYYYVYLIWLLFNSVYLIFQFYDNFDISLYYDLSWLGLISYLLINFWSSKTKSGIKAVVYNQVGDVCFLMILAMSYSFIPFINYSPFLPFSILILLNFCLRLRWIDYWLKVHIFQVF